jgi:pimeloyl-ACP methyl ester carboxylesterase
MVDPLCSFPPFQGVNVTRQACAARLAFATLSFGLAAPAAAQAVRQDAEVTQMIRTGTVGTLHIARQGVMYLGGRYGMADTIPDSLVKISGQAYVFYQIPARVRHDFPLVLIHGSQQTGANFLGTPDGRSGWIDYFVKRGWQVYVVDQPGRGKSGYSPEVYGPQTGPNPASAVENRFTAPELNPTWPQAILHTQWPGGPGSGTRGQYAFDQFYMSQVPNMPNTNLQYELTTRAMVELLAKIGPSVIVTHSMAGPLSWLIPFAAGSDQVKAILALEPSGPTTNADGTVPSQLWGLTPTPITYEPAITDPAELGLTRRPPAGPDVYGCFLQAEPAHTLPWLAGIPIAVVTTEASYHAPYDGCTSAYLTQAGVTNEHIQLGEHGIHGNAHMMMLEKNNLEIAALLERWLIDHLRGHRASAKQGN